jgi:hypothetical protein
MLRKFLYSSVIALGAMPVLASAQFAPVGPQQPSVTIDASVSHTATPDTLNVSVSCPNQMPMARQELAEKFATLTSGIKTLVNGDGVVRKPQTNFYSSGYGFGMPMPVEPTETPMPTEDLFSGDLTVAIRNFKPTNAMRLADGLVELGCTPTWDARLVYTGKYLRQNLKDLRMQIQEKKEAYEEALDQRLEKVGGMYSTTIVDTIAGSYIWPGGYDPESNTMDVMTTLSMTFILK